MASSADSAHAYSLCSEWLARIAHPLLRLQQPVVEARDFTNIRSKQAFYATLATSDAKLCKTSTSSNAPPTWNHLHTLLVSVAVSNSVPLIPGLLEMQTLLSFSPSVSNASVDLFFLSSLVRWTSESMTYWTDVGIQIVS